jgi:hypothetical protein
MKPTAILIEIDWKKKLAPKDMDYLMSSILETVNSFTAVKYSSALKIKPKPKLRKKNDKQTR